MIKKLKKAFTNPREVGPYLRWRLRCLQVRQVTVDGRTYHRYRGELFPDFLNHGNASAHIRDLALEHCRGQGIDVGAGDWPLPGAIPVRDEPHQNAYKLDTIPDGSLDFVFSSHCVEHLEDWAGAIRLWIRKLKKGGTLFLYLPHESMKLWNPGGPFVADDHKWMPTVEVLVPFLQENGMRIVDFNPARDEYWSFHVIGVSERG
jgi:SAM-dependent methyltransferase